MKRKRIIFVFAALLIVLLSNTAYAAQDNTGQARLSPLGSSYKTLIGGQFEFILMDGWSLVRESQYESIITKEIEGETKEIGGIEILSKERSSIPSKMFTNLQDSGGSFILIEDKLLEKDNHSQYHIKWIKDKKYYVDIYIMNEGAAFYHVTLVSELRHFEELFQQFEGFIKTLGIRDASFNWEYDCYYNNVDKYMIFLPEGWKVDNKNEFASTSFFNPDLGKFHIYKEQLRGITPDTYMRYSNKKIEEGLGGTRVLLRNDDQKDGHRIVEYIWTRPEIKTLEKDFNYYYEINVIPRDGDFVYTYIMKTDKENLERAFTDFQDILRGFAHVDYDIKAPGFKRAKEGMEVLLEGNEINFHIPKDKTLWGLFSEHIPGNYMDGIKIAETNLGHRFEFIMTYSSFASEFPRADVKKIYGDDRIMMLTLQPWIEGNLGEIMIPGIVAGEYDEYLKGWARGIKELGEPVLFRFANEMNGDWDPWCVWFFAKDHDLYIKAWQHVYELFREEGADNAYFVWNPHDRSFPNFKWNNPHLYYPGDDYVDWVGLTGYNNGTSYNWDEWRDFGPIYEGIYEEYSNLYPDKPLIITEFACNEDGGDKAAWIRDAFNKLAEGYTGIKIAVWFNQVDGRWQYPIYSTPEAKEAFIEGLKHERFIFEAIKK